MSEGSEHIPEIEGGVQVRGTIANKEPKPAGLLPKKTQQLVILGVAVAMVLIMWLTGAAKRTTTQSSAAPQTPARPPNPTTVEDFKRAIEQQQAAKRQPISPSSLARLRSLGLADDGPAGSVIVAPDGAVPIPWPSEPAAVRPNNHPIR